MTPTLTWIENFGHGALSTNGGGICNGIANATVTAGAAHNGSYGLYLNSTGAVARIQKTITSTNMIVFHMDIKFPTSLPSALCTIFAAETSGTWVEVYLDPADGKVYAQLGDVGTKCSAAITTGSWFSIDIKANLSANPNTVDVSVNGTAATQLSVAIAAQTCTTLDIGTNNSVNFQCYAGNLLLSNTAGDYPISVAGVEFLTPSGDDSANSSYGTNVMERADGTDIDGSSVLASANMDSVPFTQTSEYVRQNATGATNHCRVNFADTTHTNILGVAAMLSYKSSGTTANNGSTRVYRDASNYTTVFSGDMSESSLFYKSTMVTLASVDQTGVNALQGDVGFSSDASPLPQWCGLGIQVAYGAETASGQPMNLRGANIPGLRQWQPARSSGF